VNSREEVLPTETPPTLDFFKNLPMSGKPKLATAVGVRCVSMKKRTNKGYLFCQCFMV
jgi:hypothetical protein